MLYVPFLMHKYALGAMDSYLSMKNACFYGCFALIWIKSGEKWDEKP